MTLTPEELKRESVRERLPRTVLIYSGGLDSTVLLYKLMAEGHTILPLSFNYGQRHFRELRAAEAICKLKGLSYEEVQLPNFLFTGSSQTSPEIPVPDGHYAEESMKLTVVPNRNMVMLAMATSFAISKRAGELAYAAHAGDHAIYPDCRPEFTQALGSAIRHCDWNPPTLFTPFINMTKSEVVKVGAYFGVPFELTWSCYKGQEHHCGLCGTCSERREAFDLARVPDPTVYNSL